MPTLMFRPEWEAKILDGTKTQTVRPRRSVPWKRGREIELRKWSGVPYRSIQIILRRVRFVEAFDVVLAADTVRVAGKDDLFWDGWMSRAEALDFAKRDGFQSYGAMVQYFVGHGGIPFVGTAIRWEQLENKKP